MRNKLNNDWPVLTRYDRQHLARIALPLGGIGTGTVSLGGRGDLRDWEIMNRPAKGFIPTVGFRYYGPFFALFCRSGKEAPVAKILEGPLELYEYEGPVGSTVKNHGLPRFRNCEFAAAYPFGQVLLSDKKVPLTVRIEAFNPLIPGDADKSGIPLAILRYVLTNKTDQTVTASVCGTIPNYIGQDGSNPARGWAGERDYTAGLKQNRNKFRNGKGLKGIFMYSDGVDKQLSQWGTMAFATTAKSGISYRTAWANLTWGDSLLDFWDDFTEDGAVDERDADGVDGPVASLAVRMKISPHGSKAVTFLLGWHFPNRQTWNPQTSGDAECCAGDDCTKEKRVGNYYATQFPDAWGVLEGTAPQLAELEAETIKFVSAFCKSDLPEVVKEAALYNLAHLRSQTCFRTEDGRFFGFEGCHDSEGCCWGSCTHVWNYEQATAFLFGRLAKSMREVEFDHATRDDGLMSFRVNLPISRAREFAKAAADGQMGCLMKLYRDWQLSGDDKMLKTLWPKARKAVEFCWIEGGWDADQDGVMEGCQHNTMDVEYYGPNPQMGFWYLGALRSVEEMALHLGDNDFAAKCRKLFENGRQWIDEHLFNGDYYEHEIRPPDKDTKIAEGIQLGRGSKYSQEPVLQLGAGCLVDQLVGQFLAHVCGLGFLGNQNHIRKTLESIMKNNFKKNFYGHFNHMRSYVLADESALLMATYPRGRRPKRPFPYYNEVMTGFEYAAAVHMLYEGQINNGLKCIEAIRARYDGRKRSPFNEAECGHHYARSMASWAAVLALTGFRYSGVTKTMTFAPVKGMHFWSNGYAWGTCRLKTGKDRIKARLKVFHGAVKLKQFEISDFGILKHKKIQTYQSGETGIFVIEKQLD